MNNYVDQKRYRYALQLIEKHQDIFRENKKSAFIQEILHNTPFDIVYTYQDKELHYQSDKEFSTNNSSLKLSSIIVSWINSHNISTSITIWT